MFDVGSLGTWFGNVLSALKLYGDNSKKIKSTKNIAGKIEATLQISKFNLPVAGDMFHLSTLLKKTYETLDKEIIDWHSRWYPNENLAEIFSNLAKVATSRTYIEICIENNTSQLQNNIALIFDTKPDLICLIQDGREVFIGVSSEKHIIGSLHPGETCKICAWSGESFPRIKVSYENGVALIKKTLDASDIHL
jgi:hypothetical protein